MGRANIKMVVFCSELLPKQVAQPDSLTRIGEIYSYLHQLHGSNSLFSKSFISAWPASTSILLKFLPGTPSSLR